MTEPVKSRRYDATRRREAAQRTRQAVLDAAARVFAARGYAAATMAAIAAEAGVALDTVYATAGPKPTLFRLLIEAAIAGTDHEVPVLERDYVPRLRAEPSAAGKLDIYAEAITSMQQRLAPAYRILQGAAGSHPELAEMWQALLDRRARNMPLLAGELARTGALRPELTVRAAADDIWVLNSTEVYCLLVYARGWTPQRYQAWLSDRLKTLLLRSPGGSGDPGPG